MSYPFESVAHAISGGLGAALTVILANLVGAQRKLGTDVVIARLFLAQGPLMQSVALLFAGLISFVSGELIKAYLMMNGVDYHPYESFWDIVSIISIGLTLIGALRLWTALRARSTAGGTVSRLPGDVCSRD